jgi:hypothetical protein
MEIVAFLGTIVTAMVSWIAWIFANALFSVAKKRIQNASQDVLSVKLGNCLWMGLGAAVSLVVLVNVASLIGFPIFPKIALSIAICTAWVGTLGRYHTKEQKTSKRKSSSRTKEHTSFLNHSSTPGP